MTIETGSNATRADLLAWCALAPLPTRRLRARVRSLAQLRQAWRAAGSPRLSAQHQGLLEAWQAAGGQVRFCWQAGFPALLAQIADAPAALFGQGDWSLLCRRLVAVVGSRAATPGGVGAARRLAAELTAAGAVVVSGLAQGIDRAAHDGALAAGGRTIAIPGSGLQRLYPAAHRPLAAQIQAAGGLLLSEYPPWIAARPALFPERNRLISGVTRGVLVVQAARRSGSLITARCAAEQGREVLAVPGAPGLPVSGGVNQLLRDGAALVESAADVFDALGWAPTPGAVAAGAPADATLYPIWAALDHTPVGLDTLAARLQLAPEALQRALVTLELGGFVQPTAHGYISASPAAGRPG